VRIGLGHFCRAFRRPCGVGCDVWQDRHPGSFGAVFEASISQGTVLAAGRLAWRHQPAPRQSVMANACPGTFDQQLQLALQSSQTQARLERHARRVKPEPAPTPASASAATDAARVTSTRSLNAKESRVRLIIGAGSGIARGGGGRQVRVRANQSNRGDPCSRVKASTAGEPAQQGAAAQHHAAAVSAEKKELQLVLARSSVTGRAERLARRAELSALTDADGESGAEGSDAGSAVALGGAAPFMRRQLQRNKTVCKTVPHSC
jgi:hypothetical protein